MKRVIRILAVALLISLLLIPFFATEVSADSPTLKEYLNTGGDGDSAAIYGANYTAMQFTSNATAHTVVTIQLVLKRVGSPGTISVALRNADSGEPSETYSIAYATYNGNNLGVAYSWMEVTMTFVETSDAILGGTQYAIVVSAPNGDGSNYVMWQVDSGGGLANAISSASTDGGITWTQDAGGADCLFQVFGTTVLEIYGANVFQGYLTSPSATYPNGDLLFCLEALNIYPPYANTSNAKNYFQVQLIGLDTTTVLAASPMMAWGYKPHSIYLSASSSSSITVGGAYILKIVGTFASPPNNTYTLTSADWKGTNLSYLDDWMIDTAYNIETYYGLSGSTALVQSVTNAGDILTDTGGAIFTNAIPGISQIRPDKFGIPKSKPQFTAGTDAATYDSSKDYQVILGTEVAGDLDTWGDLFSMDGDNFGGWALAMFMGIVILAGLILGGRAAIPVGVVAGVPILFIGNYTGLIGIQWTAALGIAFVGLFVWWWFVRST